MIISIEKEISNRIARWQQFLLGYWTLERPTKPGHYPVCGIACSSVSGVVPSETVVVFDKNGQLKFSQTWGGWWWSEPLPTLLSPPDVEYEQGYEE